MRLESLRIRGLGPFRDEVALDLSELGDARLVAVTGGNGQGKSTLLELALPGALFRDTPTRGSLKDLATSREAMLEATVVNGSRYTIRHLVDQVSGKGESVVLDGNGAPVIESAKVSEFSAWAAKHLPAPEVLFASVFGAQGSGGFLAAKPAERKSILLRVLGIERMEAWASGASERARSVKQQLDVLRARLTDEQARGWDVEEASTQVAAAEVDHNNALFNLEAARRALAELERQAEVVREAHREADALRTKRADLSAQTNAGRTRVTELATRLSNNAKLVQDQETIRKADTSAAALRELIANLEGTMLELEGRRQTARATAAGYEREQREAQTRAAAEEQRIARLRATIAGGDEIASAEAALPAQRAQVDATRGKVQQAEEALEALRGQRLAGADERIAALRAGLERIAAPESTGDAATLAVVTLETDDAALNSARKLPGQVQDAHSHLIWARDALTENERILARLNELAARAGEIEAARTALAEAEFSLARELANADRAHKQEADAFTRSEQLSKEAEHIRARANERRAELAKLEPTLALLPRLETAEARIAELEPMLAQERASVATLEQQLTELPEPAPVPPLPDTATARLRLDDAERRVPACLQTVTLARQRHQQAVESAAKQEALQAEQATLELELGDWSRLAEDLGKKGLQAAEIDACGPELTELANDLLRECHGPRFTVRIDTQRLSADGKKTIEGCDVTVLDTVGGREAEGSTFSGGERVIIGEAIALALSMLACRRSGLRGVTLVRDESGAALDPENAEVYVRMLRRAADQVGASMTLIVSHLPTVVDLCDACIEVANGQARIRQ